MPAVPTPLFAQAAAPTAATLFYLTLLFIFLTAIVTTVPVNVTARSTSKLEQ